MLEGKQSVMIKRFISANIELTSSKNGRWGTARAECPRTEVTTSLFSGRTADKKCADLPWIPEFQDLGAPGSTEMSGMGPQMNGERQEVSAGSNGSPASLTIPRSRELLPPLLKVYDLQKWNDRGSRPSTRRMERWG